MFIFVLMESKARILLGEWLLQSCVVSCVALLHVESVHWICIKVFYAKYTTISEMILRDVCVFSLSVNSFSLCIILETCTSNFKEVNKYDGQYIPNHFYQPQEFGLVHNFYQFIKTLICTPLFRGLQMEQTKYEFVLLYYKAVFIQIRLYSIMFIHFMHTKNFIKL